MKWNVRRAIRCVLVLLLTAGSAQVAAMPSAAAEGRLERAAYELVGTNRGEYIAAALVGLYAPAYPPGTANSAVKSEVDTAVRRLTSRHLRPGVRSCYQVHAVLVARKLDAADEAAKALKAARIGFKAASKLKATGPAAIAAVYGGSLDKMGRLVKEVGTSGLLVGTLTRLPRSRHDTRDFSLQACNGK